MSEGKAARRSAEAIAIDGFEELVERQTKNRRATLVGLVAAVALFLVLFWTSEFLLVDDLTVAGVRITRQIGYALSAAVAATAFLAIRASLGVRTASLSRSLAPSDREDAVTDADYQAFNDAMSQARPTGVDGEAQATASARETEEWADFKTAQRRARLASLASIVVGLATSAFVLYLMDVVSRHTETNGFFSLFLGIGAGVVAASKVRALIIGQVDEEAPSPESGYRLVDELRTRRNLEVRQKSNVAELLGFDMNNAYELLDGTQAWLGFADEASSMLGRLFLGSWRGYRMNIRGLDQVELALERGIGPFARAVVKDADGKPLGTIRSRFGLAPRYEIAREETRLYRITGSMFFRRRFRFLAANANQEVGRIEKTRPGFFRRLFMSRLSQKDAFRMELPEGESADKALALASVFLIDMEQFEPRSPLPTPLFWVTAALLAFWSAFL